jgi:hypothetical protein
MKNMQEFQRQAWLDEVVVLGSFIEDLENGRDGRRFNKAQIETFRLELADIEARLRVPVAA